VTARPGTELRNAALAYAARGIPVLPLHHPVTHPSATRPVPAGQLPGWVFGCSCGEWACAQAGKHPLGRLVPHGLREATTNRARILAWWTQQPQANVGLACGHRFDVLDLDGPAGVAALRAFADRHGIRLPARGPVVRSGRAEGGWHYYLAPAGLPRRARLLDGVDYQALGAYVVAPPSRHATGHRYAWARDLTHPLPAMPGALYERLVARNQPAHSVPAASLAPADAPGHPWAGSALAAELGPPRHRARRPAERAAVGVGPQSVQPRRRRRPGRQRGRSWPPRGRRALRPARRRTAPDPADLGIGPPGRPGPPPPATPPRRARPHQCSAPARHPGGGRADRKPRGEVTPAL
jgi:hypothetical protein